MNGHGPLGFSVLSLPRNEVKYCWWWDFKILWTEGLCQAFPEHPHHTFMCARLVQHPPQLLSSLQGPEHMTCDLGWPATTGILMYEHGFCYGQAVLTQNQFALRVPTKEQTPQMTEPLGPHKPLHADDTWREVHHLTENKKLNQLQ